MGQPEAYHLEAYNCDPQLGILRTRRPNQNLLSIRVFRAYSTKFASQCGIIDTKQRQIHKCVFGISVLSEGKFNRIPNKHCWLSEKVDYILNWWKKLYFDNVIAISHSASVLAMKSHVVSYVRLIKSMIASSWSCICPSASCVAGKFCILDHILRQLYKSSISVKPQRKPGTNLIEVLHL